jgi:hypothetical protein
MSIFRRLALTAPFLLALPLDMVASALAAQPIHKVKDSWWPVLAACTPNCKLRAGAC